MNPRCRGVPPSRPSRSEVDDAAAVMPPGRPPDPRCHLLFIGSRTDSGTFRKPQLFSALRRFVYLARRGRGAGRRTELVYVATGITAYTFIRQNSTQYRDRQK